MARTKKSSLRETLINEDVDRVVDNDYYTPAVADFVIGAVFEQRWVTTSEGWIENKIDMESFRMLGGSCFVRTL